VPTDRSNYMHPLGFAYFPDGDHVGKNELEPTVSCVVASGPLYSLLSSTFLSHGWH